MDPPEQTDPVVPRFAGPHLEECVRSRQRGRLPNRGVERKSRSRTTPRVRVASELRAPTAAVSARALPEDVRLLLLAAPRGEPSSRLAYLPRNASAGETQCVQRLSSQGWRRDFLLPSRCL